MTSDLLEENADLRKQVEKLENELTAEKEYNATLRKEIDEYTNSHTLCSKYKELEKENVELKSECRRCVYTDRHCVLSDYGKDRNGICDHFKDVFDEVAELKNKLEHRHCVDCSNHGSNIKLLKAKEIINGFLNANTNIDMINAQREAEQFLKEE